VQIVLALHDATCYYLTVNKGAHAMQASNNIAIYNATRNELVENEVGGHNWDVQADDVYALEDYAWVDADELADYEHEDLLEAGWVKL
jgi:hypothetical protein